MNITPHKVSPSAASQLSQRPALVARSAAPAELAQLRQKIALLDAQIATIEAKRQKMLSPVYRQSADQQISLLRRQRESFCRSLASLSAPPALEPPAPPLAELPADAVGGLEVRFDLSARTGIVQNRLGVAVGRKRLSYQEALDRGFDALARANAEDLRFESTLNEALNAFLEAISEFKTRYEAYFGLGYLFSLLGAFDQSLYYLRIAADLDESEVISELIAKVEAAKG